MAAGRRGGYRDHESRDRESDIEVSRRRDSYRSQEDYDRFRDGARERERTRGSFDLERGKDGHYTDRVRVRQKDIKEREVVNGEYRSASSMSDSGSSGSSCRRGGYSVRTVDREPGELSSGSGSDDVDVYELQLMDNGNFKSENGTRSPPEKKRKFSPIVWDREEKAVSISSSKNKTDHAGVSLPPPPPLPLGFRGSPHVNMNEILPTSPPGPDSFHSLEPSLAKPPIAPGPVGSIVSESPSGSSPVLSPKRHWNNDQEPGQLEEEDYVPMRNISASRWADKNNYPGDEGEVSDGEGVLKKRKKMPVGDSVGTGFNTKTVSPELGELMRGGSEGACVKSGSDDEVPRVGSVSEDEYLETDLDKNDLMEVDEEVVNDDVTGHQVETDSEKDDAVKTPELTLPPQRSINMLQGCRSVDEFERLNKIDEGTYGVVYRARDKKTGEIVALKKVKMEKEREGFPLTSLREINILLSLHHPSIVDVKEVVVGSSLDSIFMVMEYMEHDLKGLMEMMKQPYSQSEVKCLMLQLLEGVKYLHDNWVLHRDLKTSNLLLNNRGELKICDFGLSRQYGSPLKPYTHLVVTLWYRAPELLLGAKQYSTAIDMWSLGCIMAELLSKEPLFSGKTEFDQLDKIFRILGTPSEKIWPGFAKLPGVKVNFVKQPYNKLRDKFPPTSFSGRPTLSEAGFDLLNKLLTYDPDKRITAEDALKHEWFHEVPLPKSKDFMPTFPAQHAQDRRLRRILKSPDPLEEQRRKELQQGELGTGGLFG